MDLNISSSGIVIVPERKEALIMPIAWAVRRGPGRSDIMFLSIGDKMMHSGWNG